MSLLPSSAVRRPSASWPIGPVRAVAGLALIALTLWYWPPTLASILPKMLAYPTFFAVASRMLVIIFIFGLPLAGIALAAACPARIKWILFAPFAVSLVTMRTFFDASGHVMQYTDWLTLWQARANTADALAEYAGALGDSLLYLAPLALGFALIPTAARRTWPWCLTVSALSVGIFVAVCVSKQGGATDTLPPATSLYGMMAASAFDRTAETYAYTTDRKPDAQPAADNIILVVDESIRHDFFERAVMTKFQEGRWRAYDFGLATSMANCSASTNIMLRKFAGPNETSKDLYRHPLIWSLAHNAGFHTWLLDAQQRGKGHDYFDSTEREMIDNRPDVLTGHDTNLLGELRKLPTSRRNFVLIIKQGAHFPYADNYPAGFHSKSDVAKNPYVLGDERRGHYLNALDYQTTQFMEKLSKTELPGKTILFYTSDHGQNIGDSPGLTHCSSSTLPTMDEGAVPLAVFTNFDAPELEAGSRRNRNLLSHFDMMSSVVDFLGYGTATAQNTGLLRTDGSSVAGFIHGNPFGLFGVPPKMSPFDRQAYIGLEERRWGDRTRSGRRAIHKEN